VLARTLLVAGIVLYADVALAHPPPLGIGGFWGGLLHPAFVPAHVLAVLAIGLLIGQQMPGWGRIAPLAFLAGLVAGLGVMTLGVVPVLMNEAVLTGSVAAGLAVVLARPLPEAAGCGLAAVIGFCIALDSPPDAVSVREANAMLTGTGLGATLLMAVAVQAASRLKPHRARIFARILGSWVAASAILVLAVRFAR
jgi:urease accessory protein